MKLGTFNFPFIIQLGEISRDGAWYFGKFCTHEKIERWCRAEASKSKSSSTFICAAGKSRIILFSKTPTSSHAKFILIS